MQMTDPYAATSSDNQFGVDDNPFRETSSLMLHGIAGPVKKQSIAR
jgi:hypothetical protein